MAVAEFTSDLAKKPPPWITLTFNTRNPAFQDWMYKYRKPGGQFISYVMRDREGEGGVKKCQVVSDLSYFFTYFLRPQHGHFCRKWPYWGTWVLVPVLFCYFSRRKVQNEASKYCATFLKPGTWPMSLGGSVDNYQRWSFPRQTTRPQPGSAVIFIIIIVLSIASSSLSKKTLPIDLGSPFTLPALYATLLHP